LGVVGFAKKKGKKEKTRYRIPGTNVFGMGRETMDRASCCQSREKKRGGHWTGKNENVTTTTSHHKKRDQGEFLE